MSLQEFLKGIQMIPEAIEEILQITVSEEEYRRITGLFWSDRRIFYEEILRKDRFRLHFLYYFCRMACDTYEQYRQRNIKERIFWDTFYDLTLWCENCYREFGEYGIDEYDWFFRHLECRIFRLGRLEFEMTPSMWTIEENALKIKRGTPVISIQIPQGEKLDIRLSEKSFKQAFQFWGEEYPYLCHSWLLSAGLTKILPADSNILKFQSFFKIIQTDYTDREAEKRIYGCVRDDPNIYPQRTSLQKKAAQYLIAGGRLGTGTGVLKTANVAR